MIFSTAMVNIKKIKTSIWKRIGSEISIETILGLKIWDKTWLRVSNELNDKIKKKINAQYSK